MEQLEQFATAARRYRVALRADEPDVVSWTRGVRNAVAQLYLAAALLPSGASTDDSGPPDRSSSDEDQNLLAADLEARLGENDPYREIWDPTEALDTDSEPIECFISRDLAEIDGDVHEALGWLEQPHADLLWDLRFAFEQHWGKHAVDVLRPLHVVATGHVR
jgi:hypothetical protein